MIFVAHLANVAREAEKREREFMERARRAIDKAHRERGTRSVAEQRARVFEDDASGNAADFATHSPIHADGGELSGASERD